MTNCLKAPKEFPQDLLEKNQSREKNASKSQNSQDNLVWHPKKPMIVNIHIAKTSGLSSTNKEIIPILTTVTLPENMENPNPTKTPMMIEALTVNEQAPFHFQNPKTAPSAHENPSSGTIKIPTSPSANNGVNSLFNEPLDLSPANDVNKMVFQSGTQGVGLQMHGKLRLPKHVCDDHHIKFRHSRKKKAILSTNMKDSLSDSDSVSQLEMPREVISEALRDFLVRLKLKGMLRQSRNNVFDIPSSL
ncbi:hypothetical protein ACH5RR_026444 [Cinchona calisaya]|uniref:Uncharacterized protein n=1 Tax=Cinchona calisaya TaxID=153742 RepID=A0ABD2Z5S3_9GENT